MVLCMSWLMLNITATAQNNLTKLLDAQVQQLKNHPNFKQGILGFSVMDANTGALLYSQNGNIGLPFASCTKTIIAIASLKKLGTNYTFNTEVQSAINNDTLLLNIKASGDPSLGSFAFTDADRLSFINGIIKAVPSNSNIQCIKYKVSNDAIDNTLCKAWTWEDMGNGYGALAESFNWRENLVDIFMNGGKSINASTSITSTEPTSNNWFTNVASTGAANSGDRTNVYRAPNSTKGVITGTIPLASKNFEIHASYNGIDIFTSELVHYLFKKNMANSLPLIVADNNLLIPSNAVLYKHTSPPLDSLVNRFLRKSINIYGEAFLKTIGKQAYGEGTYDNGLQYVNELSRQVGIDTHAVHIFDGSGLSPQNRITPNALCKYLYYAQQAAWGKTFYRALPIINGLPMKSGSIHQTRAYTGYATSSNGKRYIYSIVAHNYDGSGKEMQSQLWEILDILK